MPKRCRSDKRQFALYALISRQYFAKLAYNANESSDSSVRSYNAMIPTEFFHVSSRESINVVELTLPVTVDTEEFDQLNAQMSRLLVDPGGDRWVLDLSHVSYMGSS